MKVINTEKKRKTVLVTFENNRTFVVDPILVKKYDIYEGNDTDMMGLLDENEDYAYSYGLEYAFKILGMAAKTQKEMREKLYDKFVQTNAVNRIIERLNELKYINDTSYAEDYVSYKKESRLSKRAIVTKLREKGIEEDIIQSAMTAYPDEDELSYAEFFAVKLAEKYDSLEYEKLKNKLYSRLASKGFSTAAIYHATAKLKETYNETFSDRDALTRTAARMSMRGMDKSEIYESLIKKSNSKDYDELISDILNELFM